MNAVKVFFANLKLQHKMMLCFTLITALLFLVMGVCIRSEYSSQRISDEKARVEQVMEEGNDTFARNYSLLLSNTSRMLLETNVFNALSDIRTGENIQYAQYYQQFSERLSDFAFQMEMLDSVCFFYNGFSYGSLYGAWSNNPYGVMDKFEESEQAINFYPANYTDQTEKAGVFPIAIQVSFERTLRGESLSYSGKREDEPLIVFWVFVKQDYIENLLQIQATSATDRFYLANEEGDWFTPPDSAFVSEPYPETVETFIRETEPCLNKEIQTVGDTFYVSKMQTDVPGIYLIHVFAKSTVEYQNRTIYSILTVIWVISVLAFSGLTILVTTFLTKPFERLREIIRQINNGSYEQPKVFKYRDEVGLLGTQINQMYQTIQKQIEQIKEEESQKAKAEIQMYSEQINPHFLYNTLECIHFQILNEHTETAAKMIESLGQYLRITLSQGQLMIPLEREISHVTQYMNIINSHSEEAKIAFSCHCEPEALQMPVLKLILQPLVENAVKHGFSKDLRSYILPPEISIEIQQNDGFLVYEIIDNGKGIDMNHAWDCIRRSYEENGKHFGLHNIYQRLISTYGESAGIEFESIPYFRNVVRVKIPLDKD